MLQEKLEPTTINFDLMINFDFIDFIDFLVALLIMLTLLSEQARGRPTWSMWPAWCRRAQCGRPLLWHLRPLLQ